MPVAWARLGGLRARHGRCSLRRMSVRPLSATRAPRRHSHRTHAAAPHRHRRRDDPIDPRRAWASASPPVAVSRRRRHCAASRAGERAQAVGRPGHRRARPTPKCSTSEYASVTPAASAAAAADRRPARPARRTARPRSRAAAGHAGDRPCRAATARRSEPSPVITRSHVVERGVQPGEPPDQADARTPAARRRPGSPRRGRRPRRRRAARPAPAGSPAGRARAPRRTGPARRRAARTCSRRGALLRAEDRRGARAGRSADCPHRTRRPGARRAAAARRRAPAQYASAAPPYGSGVPGGVQRGRTERGQQPRAAVVGGRAAEPDHDLAYARLDRRRDQRTQPVRGGDRRVALAPAAPGAARTPGRLST